MLNLFYLRGMTSHDSRAELERSIKLMYDKKAMQAGFKELKLETANDFHQKLM